MVPMARLRHRCILMTATARKACLWLLRFESHYNCPNAHGVNEHDRAGPKWRNTRTERCFRKARPGSGSAPDELAAVIQRCLTKERADRYQRASEVREALEAVQGAVLQARHSSEETRGPRTLVLRGIEHLSVKNGDVLLLVGTNKGAFFLRSSRDRSRWDVAGPYFHGQGIYAMAYDGRSERHRLWVSANNVMWGTFLRSSDDFGKTWTNPLEASIRFPPEF